MAAALLLSSLQWLNPTESVASAAAESVWLGRFDAGREISIPAPWQVIQFKGKATATEYRLRAWEGVGSVEAIARDSMALLARPANVDLNQTPVLCWRWRIDGVVRGDMKRKSGDDYAARVYVAFSLPPEALTLMTRLSLRAARGLFGSSVPDAAINYVWDSRYPVGTTSPNAYTDRVRMIVAETGNEQSGRWIREQRDVAADFAAHFGKWAPELISIAIATDTDDTHATAHAGFADIRFVPRGFDCASSDPDGQ